MTDYKVALFPRTKLVFAKCAQGQFTTVAHKLPEAMPRYFYPASYTVSRTIGSRVAPACLRGSATRGVPLIVCSSQPETELVPGSYHVVISANATVGPTLDALHFYFRRTGVLTAADRRRAVALALTTASSISINVQGKVRTVFVSNTPESLAAA